MRAIILGGVLVVAGCINDPAVTADPAPGRDRGVDAHMGDAAANDASTPDAGCAQACTLPVDRCLPDDPFCAEICGTPCLDPDQCGPGATPGCPEGAAYAPAGCTEEDPRCSAVVACGGQHWCRTPCPRSTDEVPACAPDDPFCWVMDDGTACLSGGCYPATPDDVCRDWSAVDGCIDDRPCERRTFCGQVVLCQPFNEPCGDGDVICPEGFRRGECQPDGQACQLTTYCAGLVACVACLPDEPCAP